MDPARFLTDRRAKPLVIVALALLFLGVGISTVIRAGFLTHERTDFTVYHAAGRAILEGTPLYEAENARGWLYMYLPIFAVLMVPLALLPKTLAAGVWYVLSVAMLLHMLWTSARLAEERAGPSRYGTFWTFVVVLVLTGWPWMSGLTRGQASVMLSWLMIVSIDAFLRRGASSRWSGAFALAMATALRIFPVLLGVWLLFQRQWRSAAACVVAAIVLLAVVPSLVFGPRRNAELVNEWTTTIALPTTDAGAKNVRYRQMMDPRIKKNQSVQATLIRWIAPGDDRRGDAGEVLARRIAAGVNAGLLVATLVACAVGARRRRLDDPLLALLQASAIAILVLLIPPVTWVHNLSLMALPLAVLLVLASQPGLPRRRLHGAAVVLWLAGGLACLIPPVYWAGGFLLGTLAVWLALVIELCSAPAAGGVALSSLQHEPASSLLQ